MAGNAGAIKAGRAFVELFADPSALKRGLVAASARLKAWGAGISALGSKIFMAFAGTGAGAFAALFGATKVFADVGSQLLDMSDRTGFAVESLSGLTFGAQQAGASAEDLETGIKKMQDSIVSAAGGSKEATKALEDLGVNVADVAGMSGEQQLEAFADGIKAIENPAARTAAVLNVFGKSGTKLIPMLKDGKEGLRAFMEEAKATGQIMSREDAEAADKFGDTLDALKGSAKFAVAMLGGSMAPIMTDIMKTMISWVRVAADWIKQNRGLVVSGLKLAGVIAGVGVGLFILGTAVTAVGTGLGVLVSIVGAILTPLGLLTAGVAGLATLWITQADAGKTFWSELRGTAVAAWGGIVDAIMAGDLALAAEIAWTGLRIVWLQGVKALRTEWNRFVAWLTDNHVFEFLDGIAEGWNNIVEFIRPAVDLLGKFDEKLQRISGNRLLSLATLGPLSLLFKNANPEADTAAAESPSGDPAIEAAKKRTIERLNAEEAARKKAASDAANRETDEVIGGLQDRLKAFSADAAAKRAAQAAAIAAGQGAAKPPGVTGAGGDTTGTFSGAGARLLGGAGGPWKDLIDKAQKQIDQNAEQIRLQTEFLEEWRRGGTVYGD